jgi:hypothetical protein
MSPASGSGVHVERMKTLTITIPEEFAAAIENGAALGGAFRR